MTIRNKLLILLLGASLIPLVAYFILDITFSKIVRNRIQRTLGSAVEERATDTLVQIVKNYEEKLKLSRQAFRFSLSHYADQVQQDLWSINVGRERSAFRRPLSQTPYEDILSDFTDKYTFVASAVKDVKTIDFDSQFVLSGMSESQDSQRLKSGQFVRTCREIYAINPESILWIYTILNDGTVSLYPSPGLWPYEPGYDLRQESWYINAQQRRPFPANRIEPLTGKTVMTTTIPLYDTDNSSAGVIAIDIDLSGLLDKMEIPQQWQKGAWKLLIRLPRQPNRDTDEARVVCCSRFLQSQAGPGKQTRLVEICEPNNVKTMIEESREGNTGFIRQPYEGVDSLWVYGSSQRGGGFPILVVPYQRIIEQVENAQQLLFRDNIRAIQIATILIFIVIVAAVVLAVLHARKFTIPIINLADAAEKLAGGDYDVTVEISTNDELQQLGDVFNQVGPGMKERQKIKQSLELAREIQQHFLPAEDLESDNFQIAGLCRYCDETGGDYYDLLDLREVSPGRIGLVLGDVSGHGIPAAMLMISSGSILRNNAPHHGDNLSAAITELNRHLVVNSESGKFMTLFYGLLDEKSKTLSWASAGHDPAIWFHAESDNFSEMENTGMPLGVSYDAKFDQAEPVTLCVGDVVVIGTDGIWEASNVSSQMYGKERLIELIRLHKDKSAGQITSLVVESVMEFCSDTPPADDITLLVIKCTG